MAKGSKKKDNVVPLRNGPAEDAVVALQLGKYRRAIDELASASGRFRNVVKHVEAKGLNVAAAKRAHSIKKSGKVDETLAELTALFQYLKILGQPFTKSQLDLFQVEAPRTPAVDKAKEHGRYCGIMGLGHDQNPYSVDSEQGQAWMEAFNGGTEERNLVMSMEPEGDDLIAGSDGDEGDESGEGEDGEEKQEAAE